MEDEKQEPKKLGTGTILQVILGLVLAIFALFAGYHGLNSYMDSRIEERINNPQYLQKLARSVRPSLIFDDRGSILADMGAGKLVKNISISKREDKRGLDIVITPAEYIGVEPVMEALDDSYTVEVERGKMLDWTFHLYGVSFLVDGTYHPVTRNRFRLELIR